MLVKNVWDNEGNTFAVPDHILEDFEIDQAVSVPDRFKGMGEQRNAQSAPSLGGWDSALPERNASELRTNGANQSANGALNALAGFLKDAQVDCTLGSLLPALNLRSLLKDPVERIYSDTLFMGGYSDDFGSRGDDNYEVHQILQMLENPAMQDLKVNVTLADIHRLRARLSQW